MRKINKPMKQLLTIVIVFAMSVLAGCNVTMPINLCHATGDLETPYQVITINSIDELKTHRADLNDIYPIPEGGCPSILVENDNGKIAICHATSSKSNPYTSINVNLAGLNGHGTHEGDIIPAPEGGCPATLLVAAEGKITICHATGSEKNPYNEITVSINGLNGHGDHEGDIIPMNGSCPTTKQ